MENRSSVRRLEWTPPSCHARVEFGGAQIRGWKKSGYQNAIARVFRSGGLAC